MLAYRPVIVLEAVVQLAHHSGHRRDQVCLSCRPGRSFKPRRHTWVGARRQRRRSRCTRDAQSQYRTAVRGVMAGRITKRSGNRKAQTHTYYCRVVDRKMANCGHIGLHSPDDSSASPTRDYCEYWYPYGVRRVLVHTAPRRGCRHKHYMADTNLSRSVSPESQK